MGLLKAIIGGLIGSAVGTAIWLAVENTGRNWPWLALLVGLLAGLGVRCCSSSDQRSSITGAIAAVMALLGLVVGPLVNPIWLEYKFERQEKPVIRADAIDDDGDLDDSNSDQDDEITNLESDEGAGPSSQNATSSSANAPSETQMTAKSIIEAARPYLAQVVAQGDEDDDPDDEDVDDEDVDDEDVDDEDVDGEEAAEEGMQSPSAIREFFDKNLELIVYAASVVLAYVLGTGGSKKVEPPSEPATGAE